MKYWTELVHWLLRVRLRALFVLLALTVVMGYFASQVQLDYTYTKALPTGDPFYAAFQKQKKEFGGDGNLLFVGIERKGVIDSAFFASFVELHESLKDIDGVRNIWSLHNVAMIGKDMEKRVFTTPSIFPYTNPSQYEIDESIKTYLSLPIYHNLFYNPYSRFLSLMCSIDPNLLETSQREYTIERIKEVSQRFTRSFSGTKLRLSGMPYIRVEMAYKLKKEMRMLILTSALVSLLILFWCFRTRSILLLAVLVMGIGVVWSFGVMYLFGYNITLLNSLIPTLVIIIGIPNCIYIINKYYAAYYKLHNKSKSIFIAVNHMGLVTFLCNLIASLGFLAFCFTDSPILVEFGWAAGVSVFLIFPVALILILSYMSLLPAPVAVMKKSKKNSVINQLIDEIQVSCEKAIHKPVITLLIVVGVMIFFSLGVNRTTNNSYILDGLPARDPIFSDLRYFERQLNGIFNIDFFITDKMPISRNLKLMKKLDKLCTRVKKMDNTSHFVLSVTEGLRFLRQGFYNNSPNEFSFPNKLDFSFMYPYLKNTLKNADASEDINTLKHQFLSQDERTARISFFVEDVGSNQLNKWVEKVQLVADDLLGDENVDISIGGSGVAFLKGNEYIMDGLKDSILLALLLISFCIFLLYRNIIYTLISVIPNIIPLVVILGLLGWAEVQLNPATVIIFGIAFGIANDLTLRIMVSYSYEKVGDTRNWKKTLANSSRSIVFTALVLVFGFAVFCLSDMKNVFSIGWLMSLTMILAAICNLVVLPIALKSYEEYLERRKKKRGYVKRKPRCEPKV